MNRLVLATLLAGSLASFARAQARPFVPPDDRVYGDIDRLAAAGLIDSILVGARPFSEREIVRLLSEARRNVVRRDDAARWANAVIDRDLARYARTDVRPIDMARVEATSLRSVERGVPDTPTGIVDAHIQPLADYRGGRELANGYTESIETYHSITAGSHAALFVNPRATARQPSGPFSAESDVRLQSGGLDLSFANVIVEAGRDYALFGQAPTGGLLLSANGAPLDMVRIASDAPFSLPWLFRAFGPVRASLVVADMGTSHVLFPHSKLAGYHLSILPSRRLELGLEVIDAMGGRGGEPASFGDRVLDAVPIFDVLRKNSDFQFSNKMAGADLHWRMPAWAGFELYSEVAIDDFDARRLKSVFLEDGGYLVGTSWSCILACGQLGVRAEYHQTGIRYYTHTSYPIATNATLLGDPLGPRGLGAYLTVDGATRGGSRAGITGAFEVRSGNSYDAISGGAHDSQFHFVLTARRPGETRARALATWIGELRQGTLELHAAAGGERVSNFAFVGGANRTNWIASASLELRP